MLDMSSGLDAFILDASKNNAAGHPDEANRSVAQHVMGATVGAG